MSASKAKIKNRMLVPELNRQQLERMRQNITAYAIDRGLDPKSAREIVNIFVDEQKFRSNNRDNE